MGDRIPPLGSALAEGEGCVGGRVEAEEGGTSPLDGVLVVVVTVAGEEARLVRRSLFSDSSLATC